MIILTPTFNHTKGLEHLINIAPSDTKIYVCDNSDDNSIEKLCDLHNNISYFKNTSVGAIQNWNFALKKTKNEFVLFLHDDEYFSSQDLENILKISKDKKKIYFFKNKVIKNNKIINYGFSLNFKRYFLEKFNTLILFLNFIGPTSSYIFYNSSKNQILFDGKLRWLVDVDFMFRLFSNKNYEFLDITVNTHLKNHSITNNLGNTKLYIGFKESLYLKNKYQINLIKYLFYLIFSSFIKVIKKLTIV